MMKKNRNGWSIVAALVAALAIGCGDDEEGGTPFGPSGTGAPADTATRANGQTTMPGMAGLGSEGGDEGLHSMSGPDARMAGKPANTINFNGVNWSWNTQETHLEPDSFPDERVLSDSNVWRRDDGTGLIRIFSNDDLSGFGFETAGSRWNLSERRAGLYVSNITAKDVEQIRAGGGSGGRGDGGGDDGGGDDGGGDDDRGGPRNTTTLACEPSDTNPNNQTRLGAIDPGAGTVSFLIEVTCNRAALSAEKETVESAGSAEDFYAGTTGTTVANWVSTTAARSGISSGSTAPTPPLYNVSVNFDVERNDTGSLRTGRLVWKDGGTVVGERVVQQAAPTTECSLPAVSSFSARAVDPRHNRITWSLPNQPSNCPYTRFELDVVTPTRTTAVQIVSDIDEYIHGALPSCPEEHCGALSDDEAVVTYKIRTTNYASHNAGPWSSETTVNRSTDTTPTAPLYLQGTHIETGHTVLSWTKPAFPEDEAGLTYSFQVSRADSPSGWQNFTAGTPNEPPSPRSVKVSYGDLLPDKEYWFRVRATHNGRTSPWSEVRAEAHVHTWPAPERVEVRLSDVKGTGSDFGVGTHGRVEFVFLFGVHDSHIREKYRTGTTAGCEISVGSRSSYRPSPTATGLACKEHNGTDARRTFNGLKLEWSQALPVNQTVWIRFALTRGTIKGPTQEVDITRNSNDEIVSQNATMPPDSGGGTDPCREYGCNQLPDPPEGVHTYGNGSLTMRWTAPFAGTNSSGNLASIRRMDMKYEACPHRWDAARSRFARIGGAVGANDTNCRTGTGTGRSTGTMTFRGSFGTIDGHQVDMWDTKMDAKVLNSLGKESSWAGWTGGHVTQD